MTQHSSVFKGLGPRTCDATPRANGPRKAINDGIVISGDSATPTQHVYDLLSHKCPDSASCPNMPITQTKT